MKNKLYFLVFLFVGSMTTVLGQTQTVREGDVFQIRASGLEFQHVHFPRKNFIIKRGGIADMKQVHGKLVVVERIEDSPKGKVAVLARQDGGKFFRRFSTVKARWPEAISTGELQPAGR